MPIALKTSLMVYFFYRQREKELSADQHFPIKIGTVVGRFLKTTISSFQIGLSPHCLKKKYASRLKGKIFMGDSANISLLNSSTGTHRRKGLLGSTLW